MHPSKRIVAITAAACAVVALSLWFVRPSAPRHSDPRVALQQLVTATVASDPSVKNCVVSVMTGDGSFEWTGAAGLARRGGHVAMTADTPIYMASVTKLYVATVVMLLSERHVLSLDDPMANYLPQPLIEGIHVYRGHDYSSSITIRQLLSHRSGIADYYDDKGLDGKSMFDLFVDDADHAWTVAQTIDRARSLEAKFVPGSQTSYSDTNFQLLGKVIEAVMHKPLHLVLDEVLFTPLKLDHTWLVGHSRSPAQAATLPAEVFADELNITRVRSNGAYWADGGLISTAREMNLFLRALDEGRLVGRDSLRQMHQWRPMRIPLQYGLGTMLFALPSPLADAIGLPALWGHSGSTGSFLYRSDGLDLYIAGTLDQTASTVKPFVVLRQVMRIVEQRGTRSSAH
jgi:D-alanyl-D-alanine carboxypeptidase